MGERVLQGGLDRRQASSVRLAVSVTKVAAGYDYALALAADGTVWASGRIQSTPYQVFGLTGVLEIAAGDYHALALRSDGTIWA
jgi:alpha-tubulin suppressor-like RCC1 family protein